MPDGASLLSVLKPLFAVVRAVAPIARRLHAERRAGKAPFSMKPEQDRLDENLEDALRRLGAIRNQDEWWRKLLTSVSAKYTRPDFFEVTSVREWLGDDQVKSRLIALARIRLIGGELDSETFDFIREKYSEATGEAGYRAWCAIAVVLAVLKASAQSTLSPGLAVIQGGLKDGFSASALRDEQMEAKIDTLVEKVTSQSAQEDPLHGKYLKEELSRICRRRGIPGIDSAVEILALIARVENGELGRAPRSDQAEAYYWAARFLAPYADKAAQAEHYLERYQGFPSASPENVTYINGWLIKAAGQTQDAIGMFSDLDTADARTSVLAIIAEQDSDAAALEWLADHMPYDHTLLNPVGWRNVVGMMAKEGKWQEALDTLEILPADIKDVFPDLLFVEGVLHAGFLLPDPIRGRLLKDTSIDFKGEIQEGQAASNHRQAAVAALERARDCMLHLGAEKRATGCEYHLTWIHLTDPALQQARRATLAEKMKDGEYAAFMLDIALNFDVPFDREPLERYLRRRIREGRDVPQDRAAQLRLIQHFGTPDDVLAYLEQEGTNLAEVLTPQTLAASKLSALVANERIADAANELDQCAEIFSPDELERFRLMFSERKGEELKGLESLYAKTGDFEDLLNLVRYLVNSP